MSAGGSLQPYYTHLIGRNCGHLIVAVTIKCCKSQDFRIFEHFIVFRGFGIADIRQNMAYFCDFGRFWVVEYWAPEIN